MIESSLLNTRLELQKLETFFKQKHEMVFGIFTIMMQILMQ
jgi:hypothetical protein